MEFFLLLCAYVLLLGISTFLIIQMCSFIKFIRTHKTQIDLLENNLYGQLRELQFKAKSTGKFATKLAKHKNSIIADMLSNVAISLLPFKKLRTILLLRKLLKNLQ